MTATHPLMKCGHAANATSDGQPVCVICWPNPESRIIDPTPPDVAERNMACIYKPAGHADKPSDPERGAFFKSRPPRWSLLSRWMQWQSTSTTGSLGAATPTERA